MRIVATANSLWHASRRDQAGFWALLIAAPAVLLVGHPALALLVGCAIALVLDRQPLAIGSQPGKLMLQSAIVLLGLRMDLGSVWSLSVTYWPEIAGYVLLTLGLGLLLGRLLRCESEPATLMAAGTAICGATAIAAVAPVIRARSADTAAALACVFLLNALAVFTMPWVGEWLEMSQQQFGVWVALAVHDTSSVVATASLYGDVAAETATTLKLGRMLWLIPLLFVLSWVYRTPDSKIRVPGFILVFLLASTLSSMVSLPAWLIAVAGTLSKSFLVLALLMVGTEITRTTLRNMQGRSFAHAVLLWSLVLPSTLALAFAVG